MKVNIGPYVDKADEERKIDIHLDKYDTWSMDHTLALLIVPMLKQLKDTMQGVPAPFVVEGDDDDLTKSTKRWNAAMDSMIWSFEQIINDKGEDQFYTKVGERKTERTAHGTTKIVDTGMDIDWEGLDKHRKKVQKGLNLFGKYYQNLWD